MKLTSKKGTNLSLNLSKQLVSLRLDCLWWTEMEADPLLDSRSGVNNRYVLVAEKLNNAKKISYGLVHQLYD